MLAPINIEIFATHQLEFLILLGRSFLGLLGATTYFPPDLKCPFPVLKLMLNRHCVRSASDARASRTGLS